MPPAVAVSSVVSQPYVITMVGKDITLNELEVLNDIFEPRNGAHPKISSVPQIASPQRNS